MQVASFCFISLLIGILIGVYLPAFVSIFHNAQENPEEYILCSAIYFKDGKTYVHQPKNVQSGFVICGRRHHNCYQVMSLTEIDRLACASVQGFLTNTDRFVTRKEAFYIAKDAKQIYVDESKPIRDFKQQTGPITLGELTSDNTTTASLISEDLY